MIGVPDQLGELIGYTLESTSTKAEEHIPYLGTFLAGGGHWRTPEKEKCSTLLFMLLGDCIDTF